MREIKFRILTENKEWEFFLLPQDLGFDEEKYLYGEIYNMDSFSQFTGLKDKNDKEIYESDIVNIDGLNVVVKWYGGAWTVEYFTSPKISYLSTFDETDIEIIGNIYEKPELIK